MMKSKLQKRYALSDEGVNDLVKGIISSTLINLSVMLPMMLAFTFIKQYVDIYFGNLMEFNLSFVHFIAIIFVTLILMYFAARNDYRKCNMKVYEESARSRIFLAEKLKELPLSYFSKRDVSDLSATMLSDATTYEQIFANVVPKIYGSFISIFVMAIMMFNFEYRLAISLFWAVPISYMIFKLSKQRISKLMKEGFDMKRNISEDFQEGIDLVQEIKAYNREKDFISQINKKYDKNKKIKTKAELIPGTILNLSFVFLKLGMVTVAIYGAYLLIERQVDLFTYLVFILISGLVFNPMVKSLSDIANIMYLDSAVERIKEINNMPSQGGSSEFEPNNYNIIFENVNFSYEDGLNVLSNVSFTAKQGEVTALVGPSGGGKTTVAKLAARFWDIQNGKISIGDVDISKIDPETLLKKFSIVFQDVMLFNSSVMENIRLGRKEATDEEVKRAAKLANCDEFIENLAEGYDTLIGENGAKLSGGERQRISIARALLKDAPIILLDESTASLDAENESKVQASISELIKDKTVIIIAHRMRTVVDADSIVVLKDGKVVESGNSKDLIKSDGIFANMYKIQMQN